MDDKDRMRDFMKGIGLFLWGSVAIGTTATALNSFPGTFPAVISVLNLVTTAVAMYKLLKK